MKNQWIELIPAEPELAKEVAEYYRRNREFLKAFEPEREENFFSEEYQRKLLKKEADDRKQGTSYRFYIRLVEAPREIIGVIGLNNIVRGAFQSSFLGGKLDNKYINRGYMSMAVDMIVKYGFEELKLHRIEGNVMPRNKASLRVMEKNGFVCEGLSRHYLKINGVWEDHVHMVRLNEGEQENRLGAFEKMLESVRSQYDTTVKKMDQLKAEGKEKTVTYRQLFANKLQYQNMLSCYQAYGLLEDEK